MSRRLKMLLAAITAQKMPSLETLLTKPEEELKK
jgi:hypothetical protein